MNMQTMGRRLKCDAEYQNILHDGHGLHAWSFYR